MLKTVSAVDWPIRYKDLSSHGIAHVEKFAGISGNKDGLLAVLPDGDFMPPMEMNVRGKRCCKNVLKNIIKKHGLIYNRPYCQHHRTAFTGTYQLPVS